MAEIIPSSGKGRKSGTRARRLSTKVDLTPMVDLGFLLITFFIFTTTTSEARALRLDLPADGPGSETSEKKTLNFVLCADNKVMYYPGNNLSEAVITDFKNTGVRHIINAKRKEMMQLFKRADDMVVLIKPTSESSYQNVTDALDEMMIGNVKRYVLMEPGEQEQLAVLKH